MWLLGETGREDDGENDNLMGARVPAANANAIYVYSLPTPTKYKLPTGRPFDPSRCRTLLNNIKGDR